MQRAAMLLADGSKMLASGSTLDLDATLDRAAGWDEGEAPETYPTAL